MRTAMWVVSPLEIVLALLVWAGVLTALSSGSEAPPAALVVAPEEKAAPEPAAHALQAQAAQERAAREAVWNSPRMLYARAWLDEYFRTSKQSSPEAEQAYLQRLSQLSAREMVDWLNDFSRRRRQEAGENQRFAATRQWNTARAAQRTGSTAARPLPGGPAQQRRRPAANYVERRPTPTPAEQAMLRDRYEPLDSFRMLFLLDTLDIRDDLRALRTQRGN